jgi:hypothetical protein
MRQQAEHALPAILHQLRSALAGEFADIRTDADAIRLAQTQPQRFARLQALNAQIAGVAHEADAMRKAHRKERKLETFIANESARLKAHIPEMDDEAQWGRLKSSAVLMLKKLNYSDAELGNLWRGHMTISMHDHRFQRLLRDAVRWQELQGGEAAVLPDSAQAPRVVEIRSPESRARLRDRKKRSTPRKDLSAWDGTKGIAPAGAGRASPCNEAGRVQYVGPAGRPKSWGKPDSRWLYMPYFLGATPRPGPYGDDEWDTTDIEDGKRHFLNNYANKGRAIP